jgi:hypothetical protein
MVHALLVLAAETEKSEVPFFVAGGVFAAWAVVVGFLGTRSEAFPGGMGAGRAVSAVSVALAAVSMALAVYVLT